MNRSIAILVLLAILAPAGNLGFAKERQPNVILFFTDDHGYADLGAHDIVDDIATPHLDALVRSGVLVRHGYSTAPQCVPSRAGLLTGRFQGRFGLDNNRSPLDGFNKETTVAERLRDAGYVTAQFGKWHLGPTEEIPQHGFQHVFAQHSQGRFSANISPNAEDRAMAQVPAEKYHIEACSEAAAAVIRRYAERPFFLYIAYRAPHTPLDAPKHLTDRFPSQMPERRRQALAMLSAVDDGVGQITAALKQHGLREKTLIFFMADNGAPLRIDKADSPLDTELNGWDGSLNTPLNGEKGMLTEGGIHIPFVVSWPGTIPAAQSFTHPISTLDVAATATSVAGIKTDPGELDGVNLVPHLCAETQTPPHDALYWRWTAQSAIREGNWKLLRGGDREYLYDLGSDLGEKQNLIARHPQKAEQLRAKLSEWSQTLVPPGLTAGPMTRVWEDYFSHYLEGKPIAARSSKR